MLSRAQLPFYSLPFFISYAGHESMQNLLVSYSSDDGQSSESTDCGSGSNGDETCR